MCLYDKTKHTTYTRSSTHGGKKNHTNKNTHKLINLFTRHATVGFSGVVFFRNVIKALSHHIIHTASYIYTTTTRKKHVQIENSFIVQMSKMQRFFHAKGFTFVYTVINIYIIDAGVARDLTMKFDLIFRQNALCIFLSGLFVGKLFISDYYY